MIEYNDEYYKIKLEDGIIYIEWLKEHYDFQTVELGIGKRNEISDGKAYPLFSDFRKVKSGSRDARERLASKDAGENVTAVAILVNSKIQKIMFSFYNSIYKAPAPAKLFTDKEKALNWLKQFKK